MAQVVVIGAGLWGRNLVRNFAEIGVLRGIFDLDGSRATALASTHEALVYATLEDVWGDKDVDAVAIAVPAETHYKVATAALEHGRHCFVEKPLVLNLDEAERLRKLAEERGLILMVGHILEHHPAVRRLKELLDHGRLGKIHYLHSRRLSFGRVRLEENALWSLGVHDISVILYLLGEVPLTVSATGLAQLTPGIEDTAVATLCFPSGAQASILSSWLWPEKEQRLVVVGSEGMAVFDDAAPSDKLRVYPAKVQWKDRVPVADKVPGEAVSYDQTEPLRAECLAFLQSIESGAPPLTDAADSIRVLRVLEACTTSMNNGGLPTRTDEPGFHEVKVHPTAIIESNVRIGRGTQIWHFSHVLGGCILGERCRVGQNVVIGPDVTVGDNVKIQNNVSVYKGVTLEDDVFCGPSMVFTNVFNPRSHIPRMAELRPTVVRRGATIGANATVVCGHSIGRYALVGAGAVVTKDVPDYGLVYGNPARLMGWVCVCSGKLQFSGDVSECGSCGRRYRKVGGRVEEQSDAGASPSASGAMNGCPTA